MLQGLRLRKGRRLIVTTQYNVAAGRRCETCFVDARWGGVYDHKGALNIDTQRVGLSRIPL